MPTIPDPCDGVDDDDDAPAVEGGYYFARLPEWILDHAALEALDVRLYGVLDRYNGRRCIPKVATLAERLHVSPDSVRRAKARLEAVGAIEVIPRYQGRRQTSNRYRLAGDAPLRPPSTGARGRVAPARGSGVAPARGQESEQEEREQGEPLAPALFEDGQASAAADGSLRRRTPRDDLWDAVVAVCGWDASGLTRSATGQLARAVKELAEAGASPEAVHRRAAHYLTTYEATLTPTALAKHWPSLEEPPQVGSRAAGPVMPRGQQAIINARRMRDAHEAR